MTDYLQTHPWWASLKHGGVLVAPGKVAEFFPEEPAPLHTYRVDQLRSSVARVLDGDTDQVGSLLDLVLERIGGFPYHEWTKGPNVSPDWSHKVITGESVKPRRLWQGAHGATLPVFVADGSLGLGKDWLHVRLGVGRGKRAVSKVVEWLRRAGQKLGLVTNGRQWRLIYAGADFDAWAEWDIDLWLREGHPSEQVAALQILLTHDNFTKAASDETPRLLRAVEETRKGQAELSASLGENVRRAVEILIRQSAGSINSLLEVEGLGRDAVTTNDVYVAACRLVMRCVVVLFAEARGDLLPRENPLYNDAYSLQALREYLARYAGGDGERLRNSHSAWPRLIALFRLIYSGSEHELLPIPAYGGGLFAPGDSTSVDPILRAIAAFEDPKNDPHDGSIHRILDLLSTAKVKVRQGNRNTWVPAPVDFSDLSSEYIGILYEGLLDYELRRAPEEDPILFLNFGDQPALPFSRVDLMSDKDLAGLFGSLGKANKRSAEDEEEETEDEEVEEEQDASETDTDDDAETDLTDDEEDEADDNARVIRDRVRDWTFRAAAAAKLAPKPPNFETEPEGYRQWAANNEKAAAKIVSRTIMQGEWYLVRWGGTRKGSGTYYTRPQLAVPSTHRTLRPLAYDAIEKVVEDNGLERVTQWAPKTPEQILSLKVCDPAMGSGSFLVGALRFLTDALTESFFHHGLLDQKGGSTIPRLADGKPFADFGEEPIPLPLDHPLLEERLRTRLKRYIVERCIYGVDIDPLAVELGRLAMWVETMDRTQPFGFLDHKLKCGNSLVGAWTDRVFDYPALALEHCSDAGDTKHDGVHFKKGAYTEAIKKARNEVLKPALRRAITSGKGTLGALLQDLEPERVHAEATSRFEALHEIPIFDVGRRKAAYDALQDDPAFQRLKTAYDAWCAVWFWEPDPVEAEDAKFDWQITALPTAETYLASEGKSLDGVQRLTQRHRFFHWELEFPDVFTVARQGFDAVLGNPPWETLQPESKEFFSNIDPMYRSYGKQEALRKQEEYFAVADVERDWLEYNSNFKALGNWASNVARPYGDGKFTKVGGALNLMDSGGQWRDSDRLHTLWAVQRKERPAGFTDPDHPFAHQGSGKPYTYKMFLEFGRALLDREGRLGMIVPSGIYSDNGSTELRELFLNESRWEWLFGFENRDKIFDIHRSFKFGPLIIQNGGETGTIHAAFMRHDLGDWENGEVHAIAYPRERVEQFSPNTRAILELQSSRDLDILEKIYANSVLLGDDGPDGWGIQYQQGDFNMTTDSKLFPPRPQWEAKGYAPDEYGHWLKGAWRPVTDFGFREGKSLLDPQYQHWSILDRPDGVVLSRDGTQAMSLNELEDVALPLYQGIMVREFDPTAKGWESGTGLRAVWNWIDEDAKHWAPQYLMSAKDFIENSKEVRQLKFGYREVARSTDRRSMIGAVLPAFPAGHKVPILNPSSERDALAVAGLLNSFAFDWAVRNRLGAAALAWFLLQESVLPRRSRVVGTEMPVAALNLIHPRFAAQWLEIGDRAKSWRAHWAVTPRERLRQRVILDVLAFRAFGLDLDDCRHVLRECDHPVERLKDKHFRDGLPVTGFWRNDRHADPELRHAVLIQVAMAEMQNSDYREVLRWAVPTEIRLRDYDLGHDGRAKVAQPVAPRIGDARRLMGEVDGWEECEAHATLLSQLAPKARDIEVPASTIVAVLQNDMFASAATVGGADVQRLSYQRELRSAWDEGWLLPEEDDEAEPYASDMTVLFEVMSLVASGMASKEITARRKSTQRTTDRYLSLGRWMRWLSKETDGHRLTATGVRYLTEPHLRATLHRQAVEQHPLVRAAVAEERTQRISLENAIRALLKDHSKLNPTSIDRRAGDVRNLVLLARQGHLEDYAHEQALGACQNRGERDSTSSSEGK